MIPSVSPRTANLSRRLDPGDRVSLVVSTTVDPMLAAQSPAL